MEREIEFVTRPPLGTAQRGAMEDEMNFLGKNREKEYVTVRERKALRIPDYVKFAVIAVFWVVLAGLYTQFASEATMMTTVSPEQDLVGQSVYFHPDDLLGTIKSVVVDVETGAARYVIVEDRTHPYAAGVAAPADAPYVAIPWNRLTQVQTLDGMVLYANESHVHAAPHFNTLPDTHIVGWDSTVKTYWGK